MYYLTAYGLSIHSELLLPELISRKAPSDIVIRFGSTGDLPVLTDQEESWFKASPAETCLVWPEVGNILVREGREVIVDAKKGIDDGLLRQAVLGPVLGLLLQQRGRLPFHASALAIGGRALAIAGLSGSGKSTLATALHARGAVFASDDITSIQIDDTVPMISPGFPKIRLWPESVTTFGFEADRLPKLHAGSEKRLSPITMNFADTPFPLRTVYVIAEDTEESIESLSKQEGLLDLIRHCHNGIVIQAAMGIQSYMQLCTEIARSIDFYRLRLRRSLGTVSDVAKMVEEHFVQGG